jgi:VIT1/CCC1 family predicted Fe2+/Mn2+ transporter
VVTALRRSPNAWVDFMMRFELGLEEPDPRRALVSAATIAGSYVAAGLIPLAPYFVFKSTSTGFVASATITLAALSLFGRVKGIFTGPPRWRSAAQTLVVGDLAATAAFLLAKAIS